ncbi:23S rRNA (guanosine(2251)-2'-O)-methyltransferase RlmB [Ahrensia sp. 13_GOM-1096m]|uniref:23S rRNA (guanosine(2251)-2'-O)-methyltransferase RlmB n=1 Tax=Ahrensia sp. 13_GOM-1096m TaxID=1380380 RepID=UPI00047EF4B4|nr:23S rRNA (guanosine(2251)-2'-O)-methyltransferase RlmB [Ahrensia sp. 13_GOM-1096m]
MTDSKNTKTPRDTHYAKLRRQFRDKKAGVDPNDPKTFRPRPHQDAGRVPEGRIYLYGLHTVRAALDNEQRNIHTMYATDNALIRLDVESPSDLAFPVEIVTPKVLDAKVGSDAVHQGVVLEADPLAPKHLNDLERSDLILVLDQVTDPHNVGAIMRSAVALNAGALITTSRHSPQESGTLAKSASGALEMIPHIEVRNLANALGELNKMGFQTVGLDSEGPNILEESLQGKKLAIVLGAEGKGLRQKTRETVSTLARLDMPGAIKSLNVSNAAALALYVARTKLK